MPTLMRTTVSFFVFFFSQMMFSQGQPVRTLQEDTAHFPYWIDMMRNKEANFQETQKAFYTYWENREITPGCGYKPFKRWEAFWETRVDKNGHRFNAMEILRKSNNRLSGGSSRSLAGSWQELGPVFNEYTTIEDIHGVGRINTIAFHPTDANRVWIGAPSGGLWRSDNQGESWMTLTDHFPTLGVSAIAINPFNPDTMYIGTGDRDANDALGIGVWKSTNGGISWDSSFNGMGALTVGALLIHPILPQTLLAATEDGIYRTSDGGNNWQRTSSNTSDYRDMKFHPTNPNTIYATGSGRFYRSIDNGQSWVMITNGLLNASRMVIGVSPDSADVVYVLRAAFDDFMGMNRSRDAGLSFTEMSTTPNILGWGDGSEPGGQAWYDLALTVDPLDAQTVWVGGIGVWTSENGGADWQQHGNFAVPNQTRIHVDQHWFEINPWDQSIWVANDGGLYHWERSTDQWHIVSNELRLGMIYKLGASPTNVRKVLTGFQDNGTALYNGLEWKRQTGGDGFECQFDPNDENYYYTSIYYGTVYRNNGNGSFKNITTEDDHGVDEDGAWITPWTISEHDENSMYLGLKNLWRTTNLKTTDHKDITWVKASTSSEVGSANMANLEHSPANPGLFFCSKSSSLLRTFNVNDATVNWQNLTANLASNSIITGIECHPTEAGILYLTQGQGVYKSTDTGATWIDISDSLPGIPVNCIVFDRTSTETLYIGTDAGVFLYDENTHFWQPFTNGLPLAAEITELEIYYGTGNETSRIRAATYGRGLWESDLHGPVQDNFPALASVIQSKPDLWVYEPFEVKFRFYKSLENVAVTGFDESDVVLTNATLSNFTGGPTDFSATITPLDFGVISIVVPKHAATDLNGIGNLQSDTFRIEYLAAPMPLGNAGPGGVGTLTELAIWLRAGEGLLSTPGGQPAQDGQPVGAWLDQSATQVQVQQTTAAERPVLGTGASGIAGWPAITFTSDSIKMYLLAEDVQPGKDATIMAVSQSNTEEFNDHSWIASARDPNGFTLHNNKNAKSFYCDVLDGDEQYYGTNRLYLSDVMIPHIYGFSYGEHAETNDFQVFVDDLTTRRTVMGNYEQRDENGTVDVRLGWDKSERYGNGRTAEFFIFNNNLNETQLRIVKNYLGAKFQIPLYQHDRFAHDSEYGFEVAGIGQETYYDHHSDAKGSGLVRIHSPTLLEDGDYLLWGHNYASKANWQNQNLPEGLQRIERTWRADATGDIGSVTVEVDENDLPPIDEALGIVLSDGDDFGNILMGRQLNATANLFSAALPIGDGNFFTFVTGPASKINELDPEYESPDSNIQASVFGLSIFPNPTDGEFIVDFQTKPTADGTLRVFDVAGKLFYREKIDPTSSIQRNIGPLAKGVYLIELKIGETKFEEKVVVQ